jgi:hypothetical protein
MLTNFYQSSKHLNQQATDEMSVSLCLATRSDIELLRKWKNANIQSFFHQAQISTSQQEEWFDGYLKRGDDYMFIASLNEKIRFGCLGCRYVKSIGWDLYNIINGLSFTQRKGLMSTALQQLLSFCECRPAASITLKVLASNPARFWYEKNGFACLEVNSDYVLMEYDGS